MGERSLAQVAYEAYAGHQKVAHGASLLAWSDLPGKTGECWEAAVASIVSMAGGALAAEQARQAESKAESLLSVNSVLRTQLAEATDEAATLRDQLSTSQQEARALRAQLDETLLRALRVIEAVAGVRP